MKKDTTTNISDGGQTNNFFDWIPCKTAEQIINNLKYNWFFPISAAAAFIPYSSVSIPGIVGLVLAFVIAVITASQIPSVREYSKASPGFHRRLSALTAVGICWWNEGVLQNASQSILLSAGPKLCVLTAVIAFPFIYACVLYMGRQLIDIFRDIDPLHNITKTEIILYSLLYIAAAVFTVCVFSRTDIFYWQRADIIYRSDSGWIVGSNAYMSLTYHENDLRQPLFAVFAAPFTGIPYLINKLLPVPMFVQASIINFVQIAMLLSSVFILAETMELSPRRRILFMLLSCFSYTGLLFVPMMEQYVVAQFWLMLCVYFVCKRTKNCPGMVLWGAGGTLLTSMALTPFCSVKSPLKNFKGWLKDMLKYALGFAVLMLFFFRFDVLYNITTKVHELGNYAGPGVTVTEKILQYTEFIRNCFIAPNAVIRDYNSWQLAPITKVSMIGVVILAVSILSAVLNRRKRSSLCALGWIVFSAVMLIGLGWGTRENGLILYSLYFGWAFLVLMFQLVEKIEDKLKIKYLVPAVCIICIIILLVINIPAIKSLMDFAIAAYPV